LAMGVMNAVKNSSDHKRNAENLKKDLELANENFEFSGDVTIYKEPPLQAKLGHPLAISYVKERLSSSQRVFGVYKFDHEGKENRFLIIFESIDSDQLTVENMDTTFSKENGKYLLTEDQVHFQKVENKENEYEIVTRSGDKFWVEIKHSEDLDPIRQQKLQEYFEARSTYDRTRKF